MKNNGISFVLFFSFCALLNSCAGSPGKNRHTASNEASVQSLVGFQLLEKNERFQKFKYREEGEFIISKNLFQSRDEAFQFCRSHAGYKLSDPILPLLLSMSSLPFYDLQLNNLINSEVLGDQQNPSEKTRSGIIFWVRSKRDEEKAALHKAKDIVYELLDGCGPGCDGFEPLSRINEKLKTMGQPPRAIPAICASKKLEEILYR